MNQLSPVRRDDYRWEIPPSGSMRVPAVIYASADLIDGMDDKVFQQACNVAALPGIVKASYAMPDAHWGYGFPIGGVAAFDPEQGGVVSAGGVGFDISCGVRSLLTGMRAEQLTGVQDQLADALFQAVPAGLGSSGDIRLNERDMNAMLEGGARWAVGRGYGVAEDLQRTEEQGCMAGADASAVSAHAKLRQRDEMGTLGSGNHYLELQEVVEVYDPAAARAFGFALGDALLSIHCGSRGLGHQIGTEFLKKMVTSAPDHGIQLKDRELACAPLDSRLGQTYLGAMSAAINCALANRQIITHLARRAFAWVLPQAELRLLYDVSHNTCKEETHVIDGRSRRLFVHRKGATRAFGPNHRDLPDDLKAAGQPVLIGGSMGTSSYILVGAEGGEALAFSSACHGAGRAMSRRAATRKWHGRRVLEDLEQQGIAIRGHSMRGLAEEAPGAYKDVSAVVEAADKAGLARKVARLRPMVCVKG